MRIPWKPVLFVLANAVLVVIQVLLILLVLAVYREDDTMGSGLGFAYAAVVPACMVFVGIGISLFVLGKFYSISLVNRLLPFLSILPFFLGTMTATLPAISVILALLIMLEISTTFAVLVRNRGKVTLEKTIEEHQYLPKRGIASFIGWGIVGFVLGGLAAMLPLFTFTVWLLGRFMDDSARAYIQFLVSYAVMGSIGGAILGRMALNDTRKAWRLALAGGLGFGLGAMLSYLTAQSTAMGELPDFVSGVVAGAFGGAAMGQALGHWKKAVFLALGGMASFAVTHQIMGLHTEPWTMLLVLPIEAAVAGVALGATMGYLERREGQASSPVPVG